jgi:peptidoglycan/xylan/chitin deacetylase (PgdA/CDA1 family)
MPVPILMYHEIGERDRYSLPENELAAQMSYLNEQGFKTLGLTGLGRNLPAGEKAVMITFDDGYATDHSQAYPVLSKFGFKAVCFLTTSFIGTDRYMSWEQVKELQRQGFDLQSHTHTHPLLATLSAEKIKEELTVSKNILEQKLGRGVQALSLPGGSLNKTITAAARECGYDYVFTSIPKLNQSGGPGVYNRFLVKRGLRLDDLGKIVNGDRAFYRQSAALYQLKNMAKRVIGPDRYLQAWRKYYKESK